MTSDEVEGVATFYSLIFRRPVGKRVLKVCDSVVCWSLAGESLMQHLGAAGAPVDPQRDSGDA